jgi:hypothetical protein
MLRCAADHRQSATESQGTIRAELRGKSGSSESRLSLQQKQHDTDRGNHNERHNQNLEKQSARFAGGSCRRGLSFRGVCHVERADPDDDVYVSVAGFNNEGQVCELRIPQPSVPALLGDERAKAIRRKISGFSMKSELV